MYCFTPIIYFSCSFTIDGISWSGKTSVCSDGTDGKIEVNISGGTPPYSYSVNNGAWMDVIGAVGKIDNLIGGIYQINIKDANGCTISTPLIGDVTQIKILLALLHQKLIVLMRKLRLMHLGLHGLIMV